jgi:hypothetical protein
MGVPYSRHAQKLTLAAVTSYLQREASAPARSVDAAADDKCPAE